MASQPKLYRYPTIGVLPCGGTWIWQRNRFPAVFGRFLASEVLFVGRLVPLVPCGEL